MKIKIKIKMKAANCRKLKSLFSIILFSSIVLGAIWLVKFLIESSDNPAASKDGFGEFVIIVLTFLCGMVMSEIKNWRGHTKNIIMDISLLCDELMNDLCRYRAIKYSDDVNKIEKEILRDKIDSYNKLLEEFIQNYFSNHRDIEKAYKKVNHIIKATKNSKPDTQEFNSTCGYIIKLRLIIYKQQEQEIWDEIYDCYKERSFKKNIKNINNIRKTKNIRRKIEKMKKMEKMEK